MKDRIKQYMEYKKVSAGELADEIDVQRSNISHILNGRNKPGATFIEKLLLKYTDLNARWLLTGQGEMIYASEKETKIVEKQQASTTGISKNVNKIATTNTEPSELESIILLYNDGTFKDFKGKK